MSNDELNDKNYIGFFKEQDYANKMVALSYEKQEQIPEMFIYWDAYKFFPCTANYSLGENILHYKTYLNILRNEYGHDVSKDLVYSSSKNADYARICMETCCGLNPIHVRDMVDKLRKNSYLHVQKHFTDFTNGVMVCARCTILPKSEIIFQNNIEDRLTDKEKFHVVRNFQFLFAPDKVDFVDGFIETLNCNSTIQIRDVDATIQFICRNKELYLNEHKIKRPIIKDLRLNYGQDFYKVHEKILKKLKEPHSNGIVLLHGLPGTGKTHYIRYLIQEINEKRLIYVPPDMTSCIYSPDFLPFMLQNRDSILIIEDAENIIKSRDDSGNSTQAVANLLNLSDGLLGDSLYQPIIATFNCEIDNIDPALLRKGRLIAHHQFGKLDVEHAQKLSDSLGFTTKITEPMVLADIYGQEETKNAD